MSDEREESGQWDESDQNVGVRASPISEKGDSGHSRQGHDRDAADSSARRRHDGNAAETPPQSHKTSDYEFDRTGAAGVGSHRRVDQVRDEEEVVEAQVVEAVADRVADRVIEETLTIHESWQAPIPPASELRAFDELVPGAAERILRMAEKSLDAQIEVDTTLAHGDVAAVKRGQWLSTAIVGASLAIAVVLAVIGAPWSVVGLFVTPSLFQFGTTLVRAIREPTANEAEEADE